MMPNLPPVTVIPPVCPLCPQARGLPGTTPPADPVTTIIDGVPLCQPHGRAVAMKRLNLAADDLAAETRDTP